ncbi:MAG: alpha/beta hydrolase, partial [Candidatus Lokiarchaeota archaeon]
MDKKIQKGANKMQEQEIKFNSNEKELAGTLTFPSTSGTFPAVLLIPGSGKVDRDENHKKMKLNAFFEISHYLAENGIASLRYDKSGVGQSGGNYYTTGFYDGVQDALAAIEYLKHQENIQLKNTFILGHSEGSIIASRLAGIGTEVAGIILLSGTAQSGEAVLKWQATQIVKGLKGFNAWLIKILHIDVLKSQQKRIDKIKRSKKDYFRQQLIV